MHIYISLDVILNNHRVRQLRVVTLYQNYWCSRRVIPRYNLRLRFVRRGTVFVALYVLHCMCCTVCVALYCWTRIKHVAPVTYVYPRNVFCDSCKMI